MVLHLQIKLHCCTISTDKTSSHEITVKHRPHIRMDSGKILLKNIIIKETNGMRQEAV